MRALEEAGLPAGVANLVLGAGPEVGAPLSEDPGVDLVSFTGGLETGPADHGRGRATVKKVALELGGKNPNVVFADADFETAVDFALTAVFLHSGQVCSAGARLIVEDSLHDRFVDEVVAPGRADPARRAVRRRRRDRAADLGGAPGEGRGVRRGRARRGRRRCAAAARRPDGPDAGRRLLLPADRARRVRHRHARGARGVLRAGADRGDASPTRTTPCASPTTPTTAWPARSGPRTPARRSGSRGGCGTARCGSTTTTPTCRRPSGAASSSPASGASSDRPGWPSTARPSTSGRTSDPRPQHWFSGLSTAETAATARRDAVPTSHVTRSGSRPDAGAADDAG